MVYRLYFIPEIPKNKRHFIIKFQALLSSHTFKISLSPDEAHREEFIVSEKIKNSDLVMAILMGKGEKRLKRVQRELELARELGREIIIIAEKTVREKFNNILKKFGKVVKMPENVSELKTLLNSVTAYLKSKELDEKLKEFTIIAVMFIGLLYIIEYRLNR